MRKRLSAWLVVGFMLCAVDSPAEVDVLNANSQMPPAYVAERSGDGRIILFADNPNFCGNWPGTNDTFLNA